VDISLLPTEVSYVLHDHREEGPPEDPGHRSRPLPDAPRFVFRPLNPRERAEWYAKIRAAGEAGDDTLGYCDLVEERLVRVDSLTLNGQPFDKAQHMTSIPLEWQVEVGLDILTRSNLSRVDQGK